MGLLPPIHGGHPLAKVRCIRLPFRGLCDCVQYDKAAQFIGGWVLKVHQTRLYCEVTFPA